MIGIDLLSTDLSQVTFADVVEFCQRKEKEGVQFDYKKELTSLAKDFAAFSNSRGGIILIGVDEHKEFGYPTTWEGVNNDKKLLEKIDQWASTVGPMPRYTKLMTDEVNGKVFILVKILEGDKPPYYVNNDNHLWVRTGIITTPIDMASPEYVELLYGKKAKAEGARVLNLSEAENVYQAYLEKAERERLAAINKEKVDYKQKYEADNSIPPYKSKIYGKKVGGEAILLKLIIQPYYPVSQLMKPTDIKEKIQEIRDNDTTTRIDIPSLNQKPVPGGVACFEWDEGSGGIRCEQFYADGLVSLMWDLLRTNRYDGEESVHLVHIGSLFFHILKAVSNYYKISGFSGSVVARVSVDNVRGIRVKPEIGSGFFSYYENNEGLLNSYLINFDLDTNILFDKMKLQNFFINAMKEIYWSFGYDYINETTIKAYLKANNWLVEEENVAGQGS